MDIPVYTDCHLQAISFVSSNWRSFWSICSLHWNRSGWIRDNVRLRNLSVSFITSIQCDPISTSILRFRDGNNGYSSVLKRMKIILWLNFQTYLMSLAKPASWKSNSTWLQYKFFALDKNFHALTSLADFFVACPFSLTFWGFNQLQLLHDWCSTV